MNNGVAFLFPGQGAQFVGMGESLCHSYPEAADIFNIAERATGMPISALSFFGPQEELNLTRYTQPCILACELATLSVLQQHGIVPDVAAGFSLGEWAALVCAGVLDAETALRFIALRALAMQEAVPVGEGGMAVILGKSADEVTALCEQTGVTPSNYNCPKQITVAGTMHNIDALLELAQAEGILVKKLDVSIPSHCPLMAPAAEKLRAAIDPVTFYDAVLPLYMNAVGTVVQSGKDIKRQLILQLTMPVHFEQTVQNMFSVGVETFIEVGPGKVLIGLVKRIAKEAGKEVRLYRTDSPEALAQIIEEMR